MGRTAISNRATISIVLLALAACDAAPQPNARRTAVANSPRPAPSQTASATSSKQLTERAKALAKRTIIVDGHVDLPYRLFHGLDARGNPTEDVAKRTTKGDFDWVRAREGGLDAPFMSIYVPAKHQKEGGAKKLADQLIDMVEGLVKAAPDKFALARTADDVERNFRVGKVSLPLGIENGAAIEGKLSNLRHFYNRGVRYITLTHSKDNRICDSSYDDRHTHGGLSPFGEKVVAEMNRLGIMIDVSHISDRAFHRVMELSATPVVATHSSCRRFTPDFERNMSDAMIRKLAKAGGVIMINFGSSFLDGRQRKLRDGQWKAAKKFAAEQRLELHDPKVKAFSASYAEKNKIGFATVEKVADHIDHVRELVGIAHVGLGSDFDGVGDSLPTGLKDASQLPNLIAVLLRRGYSERDIQKVLSGNLFRVWRAVAQHAASPKH